MSDNWDYENGEAGQSDDTLNDLKDFADRQGKKVVGKGVDAAKHAATKTLKEIGKKAAQAAKEVAKRVAKAAAELAKKVAHAALEVVKSLIQIFIETLPWSALIVGVLALIIIIAVYITNFDSPLDAIKNAAESTKQWFHDVDDGIEDSLINAKGEMVSFWNGVTNAGQYEDEIDAFNGKTSDPLDPDKTGAFYQFLKKHKGDGDRDTSPDPDKIDTTEETYVSHLMSRDSNYYTQENLLDVMRMCTDYNNEMFRYFKQYYEYKYWSLKEYYRNGVYQGLKWTKSYRTDNTSDDGKFEKLSRIHIEGELDEYGKRRFAVHWQDVMTAAYMYSINNDDVDGESSIKYKDDSVTEIEDIDPETWLTKEKLQECFDLFAYNFDYYYGTTNELNSHDTSLSKYEYKREDWDHGPTLREGGYQLGYRYKRIPDPVDDEDDHGADYLTSDDVPDGTENPFTIFVPEQAPNLISNSYEAYKYIYISTDDVPNYTPDPDRYEPPKGIYCIGRWHILNPKHFIEALDTICPYYRDKYDLYGDAWDWVGDLVGEFSEHEEILPWTDAASQGGQSRAEFFEHLGELYKKKQIVVSYEGTRYDDLDDFITSLEEQYPGWHIVWEDDYVSEFMDNLKDEMSSSAGVGVSGSAKTLTEEEIKNASEDVLNVAKVIYAEARGESYEGKIAVAQVILNRMKKSGQTATEIVTAPGQFETKFLNRDASSLPNIDELINISYNVLNGNLKLTNFDDVRWFYGAYAGKPATHGGGIYYLTIGGQHFYSETAHSGSASVAVETGSGYKTMAAGTVTKSNISGSFYTPFAEPSTYPFWSYGVTFHSTGSFDENNALQITDQEFDYLDHWAMTYDETRVKDLGEFYGLIDGEPPQSLLEMIQYYINQGDYASVMRGDSGESVKQSGCLDSTVAMIASFWLGKQVNVADISRNYVNSSGQLRTNDVLASFGLKQSGNIYGNFVQGVKAELDAGHPPIVHIKGQWGSYHTTDNGHFLTIYSYDEGGFYVLDPGKRTNSYIPTSAWATVGDLYYRSVTAK